MFQRANFHTQLSNKLRNIFHNNARHEIFSIIADR